MLRESHDIDMKFHHKKLDNKEKKPNCDFDKIFLFSGYEYFYKVLNKKLWRIFYFFAIKPEWNLFRRFADTLFYI